MNTKKQFHLTIDFLDDVENAARPFTPANMDEMMSYFAEIGISRLYWIHYHDALLGHGVADTRKTALAWAVEAAHRHGMQFFTQLRVFETGLTHTYLPHCITLPDGVRTIQNLQGRSMSVSPFVIEHPQLRIRRRPGAYLEASQREVTTIKLVKSDPHPTRLSGDDLEIWVSRINGNFERYAGSRSYANAIEDRGGKKVRVLTFSGLSIGAEYRYIMVNSCLQDDHPEFVNYDDSLMELYDGDGARIPSLWDRGIYSRQMARRMLRLAACDLHGDFEKFEQYVPGEDFGTKPERMSFVFNGGSKPVLRALDGLNVPPWRDGRVVHAKGKNEYLPGSLHPVYPEVRAYWIEWVRASIAAGADGVDIRILNHSSWTSEKEEYGFNDLVIEEYRKRHSYVKTDEIPFKEVRKINGEYFTQFLREASRELHKHNLPLQAHVCSYLGSEERIRNCSNNYLYQFVFEWERWLEEPIVDSVLLKPPAASYAKDRIPEADELDFLYRVAGIAHSKGKKVWFESRLPNARERSDNSDPALEEAQIRRRIDLGWHNENIDGINLYEGASIIWVDDKTGRVKGSEMMRRILASYHAL